MVTKYDKKNPQTFTLRDSVRKKLHEHVHRLRQKHPELSISQSAIVERALVDYLKNK